MPRTDRACPVGRCGIPTYPPTHFQLNFTADSGHGHADAAYDLIFEGHGAM